MQKNVLMLVVCLALFGCSFTGMLWAEKIAEFPELLAPRSMAIKGDRLFVSEKEDVSLYSIKRGRLLKTLARRGEGPGEFMRRANLNVFSRGVVAQSLGKLLLFDWDGQLIEEKRHRMYDLFHRPAGANYVTFAMVIDEKNGIGKFVVRIKDGAFKTKKDLGEMVYYDAKKATTPSGRIIRNAVGHRLAYDVFENIVVVGNTANGFYLEVFDPGGRRLHEIKRSYSPVKYTGADQKEYMDSLSKEEKASLKIVFPEHYPAYRSIYLGAGKLYVFTYKKKGGKGEVLVMDVKGNLLKTVYVTVIESGWFGTVAEGKYYFFKDNPETETWELHAERL